MKIGLCLTSSLKGVTKCNRNILSSPTLKAAMLFETVSSTIRVREIMNHRGTSSVLLKLLSSKFGFNVCHKTREVLCFLHMVIKQLLS